MPQFLREGYLHEGTVRDLIKVEEQIEALERMCENPELTLEDKQKIEERIRELKEEKWILMAEVEGQLEDKHRN